MNKQIEQTFVCIVNPSKDGHVDIKFEWKPDLNLKDNSKNNPLVTTVGFAIMKSISELGKNVSQD